jgi:peroxiredoxin Q/BCP
MTDTARSAKTDQRKAKVAATTANARRAERRRKIAVRAAAVVGVLLVLGALFAVYRTSTKTISSAAQGSGIAFAVGNPGPGQAAPNFTLPSTAGKQVTLSGYHGKTVLLYFHEGGGCQPCFDQIRDLEKNWSKFTSAGINQLVTVTTDPVDLLARKMRDEKISAVSLSDPTLKVSRTYQANDYGMMGDTRDGHSFLLINPTGKITWRADYGGAPDYTMYVPVDKLLADLRTGRKDTA